MIEQLSIFLMVTRTIQILRVNRELHLIFSVMDQSANLVLLFLAAQVVLVSVLVPFAMGLWGVFIHGYSSSARAYNSILMIMFAKGAFSELDMYNQ